MRKQTEKVGDQKMLYLPTSATKQHSMRRRASGLNSRYPFEAKKTAPLEIRASIQPTIFSSIQLPPDSRPLE